MTNDERTNRLRGITRDIVASYGAIGGINRIGEKNLPSQQVIIDIVEQLLAVMFPGYHGAPVTKDADLELLVGSRLDTLSRELGGIIERTLVYCRRREGQCDRIWALTGPLEGEDRFAAAGRQVALAYLAQLADIRRLLDKDVQAAYEGDPAATNLEEIIICYPGVRAIAIHRLAHPLYLLGVPLLPRIMNEWAHHLTGVDIHPGATIGEHFFIDHGTGVVIGETTEIGARVKIYQGVTLGALSFPREEDGTLVKGGKRHPTIGDGVTIYANATILGGETVIGEGAVVGGGAWVTGSVPAGSRVQPGRPDTTCEADF